MAQSNTSWDALCAAARPFTVRDRVAAAIVARPLIAVLFGAMAATAMAFAGAGLAALLNLPLAAGALLGPIYIVVQLVSAAARARGGPGKERRLLTLLLAVFVLFNQVSVGAGLVALDLERLGRQLVQRQLAAPLRSVGDRAAQLQRLSADFNALGEHSARMEAWEYPKNRDDYRASCPSSREYGDGMIADYRRGGKDYSIKTARFVRASSLAAGRAASAAVAAATAYKVKTHDATMTKIAMAFDAMNAALAIDSPGLVGQLDGIIGDAGPGGFCPDEVQARLAKAARDQLAAMRTVPVAFFAPQVPTERAAMADIVAQIVRIPHGDSDFSLYGPALIVPLALEYFVLGLFATLFPARRRITAAVGVAIGVPIDRIGDVGAAAEHVAREPMWKAMTGRIETVRGRFGVLIRQIAVAEGDWPTLTVLRIALAQKLVYNGGCDGERHLFVLKVGALEGLFQELVHHELDKPERDATDAQSVVTSLTLVGERP